MIVAVVTPHTNDALVRAFLPPDYIGTWTSAMDDRVYRLFTVNSDTPMTHEFLGLNGELLASMHSFRNQLDALNWVRHQQTQRRALLAAVTGGAQ
jgi:hypothetical protein